MTGMHLVLHMINQIIRASPCRTAWLESRPTALETLPILSSRANNPTATRVRMSKKVKKREKIRVKGKNNFPKVARREEINKKIYPHQMETVGIQILTQSQNQ